MARLVGIEISATHVRAVGVLTGRRRITVEQAVEMELNGATELEQVLATVAGPLLKHGETLSVAMGGDLAFLQHLELPATAMRQLALVVPIELEARLPTELETLVHDFSVLRGRGTADTIRVLALAARSDDVAKLLGQCKRALGREAERVGCGPLPLANLAGVFPEVLRTEEPIALVDLSLRRLDVLILQYGEPVYARTTSTGVEGLPASAPNLISELRQTFMAFRASGGDAVQKIMLTGYGATIPGAEAYLGVELGVPVSPLPVTGLPALPEVDRTRLDRFAKAIGVALGGGGRPRDLNLRQGALGFQRGVAFVKERAPLLLGLLCSVCLSYAFAAWAEHRALVREEEVLEARLEAVSKSLLGEATTDPEVARELLTKKRNVDEDDPMPYMDGFDVLIELSNAVPNTIVHDIEELDFLREHVKLTGIVSTAADAQQVATNLGEQRCFSEVKLGRVTQVINSDRQKYALDWDVRCPEDQSSRNKQKKKKADESQVAGGAR